MLSAWKWNNNISWGGCVKKAHLKKKKKVGNENKLPNCGWNFKTCIFIRYTKPWNSDGFSIQTSISSWFITEIPQCLHLLILLLLLFEQLVDLPLGHGCVLWDDAVLVHARQKQQKAHCEGKKQGLVSEVNLPKGKISFPKYNRVKASSSKHSFLTFYF